MQQPNLVLIRHGQSEWNKKNVFTGWVNIGLSSKGEKEAIAAGKKLAKRDMVFDHAYTSVLRRSRQTLQFVLRQLKKKPRLIERSWRLNERHYGALQGMNKAAMAKQYGADQIALWRRSYDLRPPLLEGKSAFRQCTPLMCDLGPEDFPRSESLKDTYRRVLPYWKKEILPALKRGERVLVVAHGNSLRALVKYLEKIPDDKISALEIPTGIPLAYEVSRGGRAIARGYLK